MSWKIDDVIYQKYIRNKKFKFIYSIGTLYMLFKKKNRKKFLFNIYKIKMGK